LNCQKLKFSSIDVGISKQTVTEAEQNKSRIKKPKTEFFYINTSGKLMAVKVVLVLASVSQSTYYYLFLIHHFN
jgi:hypothetical protein